jgi:RNA polymerase sigma factor (sigma-70 family)
LANDHGDYESLIAPIKDQMIRSVWRIVRNTDDFDDAFQEALAMIWKRLAKIRRHPNPQALILRICINAAYQVLRKKAQHRRREEIDAIPADFADPSPSAAESLSLQDERMEIFQAISKLPHSQAEAVLMRFVQELSYHDIAQALGCREATARKHVARARIRLGRLLAHLAPHSPREVLK